MENTGQQQLPSKDELGRTLFMDKEGAFKWQQRRHPDWDDNYTLVRDRVITNRLTQRQSVNIPLMKIGLRTAMAYIDEIPDIYFDSLDNDEQMKIDLNATWEETMERNKVEILDMIDKWNVLLYGRSFKKLNILEGKINIEVRDPYDILVDRFADPHDLDSAMFVIQCHMFKTLTDFQNNVNYDQNEVLKIENYFNTDEGMIQASNNSQSRSEKQQRMEQMDAGDQNAPLLGEVWVEYNEHFKKIWHKDENKYKIHYIIATDQALNPDGSEGNAVVYDIPLSDPAMIGKTADDFWDNHYPLDWWADGVEGTDIWSDSMADTLRQTNKVLNAWVSQMIENRTMRNLGMMWYNSALENYNPQTYEPNAFGLYGVPGKPSENLMSVQIPALTESLPEMQYLMTLAERASAATPIAQGATPGSGLTLGEVKILENNVLQRMSLLTKFYNRAWKDFGLKYVKLIEAAGDKLDDIEISKMGYNGTMFTKTVTPGDLQKKTKKGWKVRVVMHGEKQKKDIEDIRTLQAVTAMMPGNLPLIKINEQKLLELANLTPTQQKEVMDFQDQLRRQQAQLAAQMAAQGGLPGQTGQGQGQGQQPPANGSPVPAGAPPPIVSGA